MSKSQLETELAFQIFAANLPEPDREYRFHATRRWRADFAWPDFAVLCEVQGGIFNSGRHVRGVGYEQDCEKQNEAELAGWVYLRVTGAMIRDGRALAYLERALMERTQDA